MIVQFQNALRLTQISPKDHDTPYAIWQTNTPFYVYVYDDKLDKHIEIVIKENFVTDLVSTPRIPFAWFLFGGMANEAGLLHDGGYSDWLGVQACDIYTREPFVIERAWIDNVLLAALLVCRVPSWKARLMWLAVRAFGKQYFHLTPALEQGVPHYLP